VQIPAVQEALGGQVLPQPLQFSGSLDESVQPPAQQIPALTPPSPTPASSVQICPLIVPHSPLMPPELLPPLLLELLLDVPLLEPAVVGVPKTPPS
jgi:hypothetical protein